MRIAVLGTTGGTGKAVVAQALERGHDVVALARRPEAVGLAHPRLEVRKADARDPSALAAGVAGSEAVISALGVARGELFRQVTLYSESGRALVDVLEKAGIKRLVAVTSGGVEDHDPSFGFFYEYVLRPLLLSRAYADMRRLEATIRASALDWTLLRPTALTDGPKTGNYRVSPRLTPPGGSQISRADLADFALSALEQGSWIGGTPTVAY